MTLVRTPRPRHEAVVFAQLRASGAVKRRGPGRPRRRPHRLVGGTGDSSRQIRQYARQHGRRITIPHQTNECRKAPFNRAISRVRNRIERLIKRCKPFRRIATRDEKGAANDQAMWLIAATIVWLSVI
jgi:transposase